MSSTLLSIKPATMPAKNIFARLHRIHLHSVLGLPLIIFVVMMLGVQAVNIMYDTQSNNDSVTLGLLIAHAQEPKRFLKDFKSVDVMKLTKDTVTNQLSATDINNVVAALNSGLNPNYIAISIPMDASSDYPGHLATSSVETYTQQWADAIHNQGLHIIWRGTWSGIEGIYNFKQMVGTNRFPTGSATSAATDGNTTWLGKTYNYITQHPSYFQTGDIWAPLPERTDGIFQDSTSFLPYSAPGIQANYANFFNNLKKVSDQAFLAINKKVLTGLTTNNFTEVQSGWLYSSVFDTAGLTVVDHYGSTHTPQEMETNLTDIYHKTGHQIFLQEWSDYWDANLTASQRQAYLQSMYAVFQRLSDKDILMGFNYWGGWPGATESILTKTPTGGYQLNAQGELLKKFFSQNQ